MRKGNKISFRAKKGKKMHIYSDRLPHRAFLFSPNSLNNPGQGERFVARPACYNIRGQHWMNFGRVIHARFGRIQSVFRAVYGRTKAR